MESLPTEQNWYLLFNKANILEEKIAKDIKFSDYYPAFSGRNDSVDDIYQFTLQEFMKRDKLGKIKNHFMVNVFKKEEVAECIHKILRTDSLVNACFGNVLFGLGALKSPTIKKQQMAATKK